MKQFIIVLLIVLFDSFLYALTGSGTVQDPYRITSLADFDEFAANAGYWKNHIRLETDIDLVGRTYTTAVIVPDTNSSLWGFQGTPFTGSFDGNGKKIMNLKIDSTEAGNDYLGLFGLIKDFEAEVKNLGIENVIICGNDSAYLGGLCGQNYYATISNCYATGSIFGSYCLGGLCGENLGGTISNCYASVFVVCRDVSDYVGGLCGNNVSYVLRNCYSTGQVSCGFNPWYVGGLCGANTGMIFKCYATGQVFGGIGPWCIGGLCGLNSVGSIHNSYATGSVEGDTGDSSVYVGGLCGKNDNSWIFNSYATGSVTGNEYTGGFCGWNNRSIAGCFWDMDTSRMATSDGGTGVTTDQMKTQSTFIVADWDFVIETTNGEMDDWYMPVSDYPKLWWQNPLPEDIDFNNMIDIFDLCKLCEEWLLADDIVGDYRLKCDFNMDGIVNLLDFAKLSGRWLSN